MVKGKEYKSILFDLFDTLILFEPSLLPALNIDGKKKYSTAEPVFSVFRKYFSEMDFDSFYRYFVKSYAEFQKMKNVENREYTNRIRFDIMFDYMGISGSRTSENDIKNELVNTHMQCLASSMVFPDEHRGLLDYYRKTGQHMSIVSNFDHAPTVYKLLDKFNISDYFEAVFISDEIGWRKPSSVIFDHVLATLGLDPNEAVFIGDDYNADIIGASARGIDTVYINDDPHVDILSCDHKISHLCQLKELV